MADSPNQFSSGNPHLRIAWDATCLDAFLRDPLSYYYQHVLGYQDPSPRPALTFGRVYHEGLAVRDQALIEGKSNVEATELALECVLDLAREPEPEDFPGWTLDDIAQAGKRLDEKKRNTQALVRLITWYAEEYADDVWEPIILPDGRPAIEVSFAWPLGIKTPYGEDYLICGHLDGIVRSRDEGYIVVRERKHTTGTLGKWYFDGFKPNTQINTYSVVGQLALPHQPVVGVLVDAAQSAVNFARFDREWIRRSANLNDEWLDVVRYHIKRAEQIAERDEWTLAHNPMGCQVYGGGPYRELIIKEPAVRLNFLRANFEKRRMWNPLETR